MVESPKRWQWSLRSVAWYVVALSVALAGIPLAIQEEQRGAPLAAYVYASVSIMAVSGLIGGVIGWLLTGSRIAFGCGFVIAALFLPSAFFTLASLFIELFGS